MWIVFSVNNKDVAQMSYNGSTGQDLIDAHKTMIAQKHKVDEKEVRISFKEEQDTPEACKMTDTTDIICSGLIEETLKGLDTLEMKN